MKPRSYRQQPRYADAMAAKKKADQYVARDGQAPSVRQARLDGRQQDLNDDDRKTIRWCLKQISKAIGDDEDAQQCLEFVEAVLNQVYNLNPKSAERPQDQSFQVRPDEDPELYKWIMRHK